MDCPRCGSSVVVHTSSADHLELWVWQCHACLAQFTTDAPADDLEDARRSRRLLLNVDDRPSTRYARSRLLRRFGFVVVDAETIAETRARALRLRPNVILMDVHLPDGDGRELSRELRDDRDFDATAIVLISATLPREERPDIRALGATDYVREPVAPMLLKATLERALAQS